jgi:hypothetical protein
MNRHFELCFLLTIGISLRCVAQSGVSSAGMAAGNLHGIARSTAGLPVAEATVIARNLGDQSRRVVLSATDGSFFLSDLKPGRYVITAEKDGAGAAEGSTVDLET